MKTLFEKFVVRAIMALVLITGIFIAITTYISNNHSKYSKTVSSKTIRQSVIDSIITTVKTIENERMDSVKAIYKAETDKASKEADYWRKEAAKRGKVSSKYKFRADSLADAYSGSGDCFSIIGAYKVAIDSITFENNALYEENKALNEESEGYSRQLFIEKKQSANKDTIIASKTKRIEVLEADNEQLNCYRNHRFKSWFWKWISGQKKCK